MTTDDLHSFKPDDQRRKWDQRYSSGSTPWDTGITPPEVVRFWREHSPPPRGLAVDIGCGPGTNVAYLAALGLRVIGVDVSGLALRTARQRLASLPSGQRRFIQLVQADVSRLPLGRGTCHYALDIGCFHNLPLASRPLYVERLLQALLPGDFYHLFAFDRSPGKRPDEETRGLAAEEVQQRFTPRLRLIQVEEGRPDRQTCRWYLLQKPLP